MQTLPSIDTQDECTVLNALLIEDNADDAEFLTRHLKRVKQQRIQLNHCETLSSGLQRLAKGGIDIVFLDLSLADSAGLETVAKVRKEYSTIPVVVLTGSDDDDLAVSVLKTGAQDYLVKGQVDPSSLGRSIKYAIERQQSTDVLQWMEAVVNGSNDAIIGLSDHNSVVSWNQGAERIFNYGAKEVIGKPINDFLPLHVVNARSLIVQCKSNKPLEPYEVTYRSPDGRETVVYVSTSPISDAEGVITGVSIIAHDLTQQRLTERALRETDERLKLSLSAAKIGLWDLDLRERAVRWDSNMNVLLGLPNDSEQTIETLMHSIHTEDLEKVLKVQDFSSIGNNYFDLDFRVVWPDGTTRNLFSKGEIVRDSVEGPLRITGACFDVTERTDAQKALRESGDRLRLALESVGMGVWDWDLVTNSVWRSSKHDQLYGYDTMLPEWSYDIFMKHVLDEDRSEVRAKVLRARSNGELDLECRIKAGDGSLRWIAIHGETHKDMAGTAVRMLGSVTDITRAKRLEQVALEATKRREQIFQDIVAYAPIGIVILDSNLKITTANAAFSAMIQKDQSILLGQSLTRILPVQAQEPVEKAVTSGEQLQVTRLQVTIPNQRVSPAPKYWDLSLWPVTNEEGKMLEVVMQVFDCTATVLLEQQRDDFVASVAHDIKNPLIGAERMFSVLCEQATNVSNEGSAQMLTVLRDGNQNLLSMVQNLVDVYRYETVAYPCHFEDTDLNSVITSCIKQISHFADSHKISIIFDNRDDLKAKFIQVDAIGIRRVLMNLLHNAVKFNKEGGEIAIEVERLEDVVRVHVKDTGVGIDASDQEKLFQRFAQGISGRASSGGSGLGLYLSKQILEAHSGDITCKSSVGVGTEFVITLPLLQVKHANKNSAR